VGQQPDKAKAPKDEAASEEPFDLSKWLTNFHKSPDPDRVAWVMAEMSRTAAFKKNGALNTAFLAEVFRQYPERVPAWAQVADGKPEDDRHWIYLAVWWADVPETVELLEAAAARETPALKQSLRKYIDNHAGALLEMPLTKPERLDMLWASYFASGKAAYVERIATALMPPEPENKTAMQATIYGAARWSLTSNARQHEGVRTLLTKLRARSKGVLRTELDAILKEARPADGSKQDTGGKGNKGA
jgi:hypothetical protein